MRPAGHEAKAEARKSEAEAHMGLKALTSLSWTLLTIPARQFHSLLYSCVHLQINVAHQQPILTQVQQILQGKHFNSPNERKITGQKKQRISARNFTQESTIYENISQRRKPSSKILIVRLVNTGTTVIFDTT